MLCAARQPERAGPGSQAHAWLSAQVPVLYPFGHGLSYAEVRRSVGPARVVLQQSGAPDVQITLRLTNTGGTSCS